MRVIEGIAITAAMITGGNVAEPAPGETAWNSATSYSIGDEVILASTHRTYVSLRGQAFAAAISNASPAVVTKTDHGLVADQALTLSTTGALPAGLTAGQVYYVVNPSLNTFQLAATPRGAPINSSAVGSGVHTVVISTNLNNPPATSSSHWRDKGPTRKMAPFDTRGITVASASGTLSYEITPATMITALGVHAMSGAQSLRVQQFIGTTLVLDQAHDLESTIINSWWDHWFAQTELKKRLVVWDLYPSINTKLVLTFTGGEMEVGIIDVGIGHDIGKLLSGARLPRRDYSKKDFDDYGNEIIVPRPFSRQMSGTARYGEADAERVGRVYDRLRSKICTWEGVSDHDDLTEPFVLFGFWRTFDPAFDNPSSVSASITIEGIAEQ